MNKFFAYLNACKPVSIQTLAAVPFAVTLVAVGSSLPAIALDDTQSAKTLIARLKESKISLIDGITQSEKKYGLAVSAKFELEDGARNLSVYNAKDGRNKDAEHNILTEAAGDAAKAPWMPKVEVFEDKKHLTRSAMHLTLVEIAKVTIVDAIKKVANRRTAYSITPAVVGNAAAYEVLIASPDGKSSRFLVDAQTGVVSTP